MDENCAPSIIRVTGSLDWPSRQMAKDSLRAARRSGSGFFAPAAGKAKGLAACLAGHRDFR
jgi:hypothetical protein